MLYYSKAMIYRYREVDVNPVPLGQCHKLGLMNA